MAKIDFYLLENQSAKAIYPFAYRLLNKIHTQNLSVFVLQNTTEECQQLNNYLWQIEDISFLPHCLANDSVAEKTLITLGTLELLKPSNIILNLSQHIFKELQESQRLLEIIPDEPNWRGSARAKYRYYQELTEQIETHKIK